MTEKKLKEYRSKRKFDKTPEPRAERKKPSREEPIFVIQKHDATKLHYDLRLEMKGVLISWAVPKGPPPDSRTKRLAVRTEDHPIEYAGFEGTIPEGEYGAGTVVIWDRGTYENLREKKEEKTSIEKSMKEGKIEVLLKGKKIKGIHYLIRTDKQKGKEQWLFIKARQA